MRIVALVPGGIGDQILFFPTLDDLKRTYPNAQIDVVVEPRAKDAYRVSKSVHNTILFDFKGRNSLADLGNLLGAIREREYDVAIALGQRSTVGLLLWLTGIPNRIGYAGSAGEFFLTHAVPLKQNQYAAQMYHDLLKGLDINTPCPELALSVPEKDLSWAEGERQRLGSAKVAVTCSFTVVLASLLKLRGSTKSILSPTGKALFKTLSGDRPSCRLWSLKDRKTQNLWTRC